MAGPWQPMAVLWHCHGNIRQNVRCDDVTIVLTVPWQKLGNVYRWMQRGTLVTFRVKTVMGLMELSWDFPCTFMDSVALPPVTLVANTKLKQCDSWCTVQNSFPQFCLAPGSHCNAFNSRIYIHNFRLEPGAHYIAFPHIISVH